VLQVQLDLLENQAQMVHPDQLDPLDLQDQVENVANVEAPADQDKLVLPGVQDLPDPLDPLEIQD
jgi:hypothetical protein